jgi:ketosteroid isomerase-like protein
LRLQGASHSKSSKFQSNFRTLHRDFRTSPASSVYEFAQLGFQLAGEHSSTATLLMENKMRKMPFVLAIAAILPPLVLGKVAWADDIRRAMETANAQFLAAFNTPNPSAFLPLYTKDSVLYFQGAAPVTGPEAIKQFWESRIKLGVGDHTFDIIETGADGHYAYQVTRTTVQLVRDNREKTLISGHTVRIFEKQSDGTWKTKVHMYNRPSAP